MSVEDAFFKIRPTKRSNPEARTTLDALHQAQMSAIQTRVKQKDELIEQRNELSTQLETITDDIVYEKLEQQLKDLNQEIEKREENAEIYDYFLETGEILYKYYDIQEKIAHGAEGSKKVVTKKANPGDILSALQQAAESEGDVLQVESQETLRRDKLLESYIQKIDPEFSRQAVDALNDPYGECPYCSIEMIFSANEALFTCTKCGYQDFILIDSDKPSYKDPPREVSYYAYKRINHFNEWIAQFQAKESTEIPNDVYESILAELKKERINDTRMLKAGKIREILKKLKFNKYYEHVPHILNRLNGQNAPVMSREVEEKLRYMFKEIQPSFQKHCPEGRSNFLSYSYVLYKFCELLELDEYLPSFPLLKNRDKLYVQDKIWQKICADLKWEFIKSI
jgi:DNA repair exonuclease SbcCD ATPase subunit